MPRTRTGNGYDTLNDGETHIAGSSQRIRFERKEGKREQICCCVGLGVFCLVLIGTIAIGLVVAFAVRGFSSNYSADVRVNCIPEGGKSDTEEVCEKRGCSWSDSGGDPKCFYPEGFGYKVDGKAENTRTGLTVNLTRKPNQPSQYGGDINNVRVDFFYETPYRLRVKVCMSLNHVVKIGAGLLDVPAPCRGKPLILFSAHLTSPTPFSVYTYMYNSCPSK